MDGKDLKEYVCADCGHEQDDMFKPCEKCGSIRVVSIKAVEKIIGPKWKDGF